MGRAWRSELEERRNVQKAEAHVKMFSISFISFKLGARHSAFSVMGEMDINSTGTPMHNFYDLSLRWAFSPGIGLKDKK